MKKALLSAAALLALAGAAQAQVSVYGLIDLSYGRNAIDSGVGTLSDGTTLPAGAFSGGDGNHGNSTSRFGIKGSTDVGHGLKANFKLESSGINSVGGVAAPLFGRQAWFGLSGSFGEVRAGTQDYVPFQTMIDFDLNGASNTASAFYHSGAAIWNGTTPTARQDGALQYIGKVGALKVQVGLQLSTDAKADYGLTGKGNGAVGVTYTDGKLSVAGTFQSKLTDGGEDFTAVAGSYDFGAFKAVLGYSDAGKANKGLNLGVAAPVAGYTVGFQYAANSEGDKAKAAEFFVNREVLKNTTVYLDVGTKKVTGGDTKKAAALGVIYTF